MRIVQYNTPHDLSNLNIPKYHPGGIIEMKTQEYGLMTSSRSYIYTLYIE